MPMRATIMWKEPDIGRNIVFLCMEGLVLYSVLLSMQFKLFAIVYYCITQNHIKRRQDEIVEEYTDVTEEKYKIKNATREELLSYSLVLSDLTKSYRKFLAVNSLCLGVRSSECFGLLGIDDAGKTTNVHDDGFNIKSHFKKVQENIGYCS